MKKAFITGITGQDGSYLTELLLNKGYKVFGLVRRSSNDPLVRLHGLDGFRKVKILYGNLRDSTSLERALLIAKPDEIYNLAAQSDVGVSFLCPEETMEINYYGCGRLVNEAMRVCPRARIYQASTSEMFGTAKPPQNEKSPFCPVSPYGESKLKAYEDYVVGYRERHKLSVCSGILFNHESPRRGEHFVTRKITLSLVKIKQGLQRDFSVGNLEAVRDWGFAGDYVKAMWLMLQQKKLEDYVIATGESHSVREFIEVAAQALGMVIRWEGKGPQEVGRDERGKVIVSVNQAFYRPREVHNLRGDARKAQKKLGWKPRVDFRELVELMVHADMKLLSQH